MQHTESNGRFASWYRSWHAHPQSHAFHWLILSIACTIVIFVTGNSLILYAQDVSAQAESAASLQHLVAAHGNSEHTKNQPPVAGHILVKFKSSLSDDKVTEVITKHGMKRHSELKQVGVKILDIPADADPKAFADAFAQNEKGITVEYAEPDYVAGAAFVPNDSFVGNEWDLAAISAPQAWNISRGTSAPIIAILDSGVDAVPDLAPKMVPGYNFVSGTTDTSDDFGHGTAVAGTAAGSMNNGIGVSGIAGMARIMPVKVMDNNGFASYSTVAAGITYAADNGAKVINMSIAGSSYSQTLQDAVNYAWGKGVIVIAAAGNNSDSLPLYPAALDNVVGVSSTSQTGALSFFSSYGADVDLSAPGESIWTTQRTVSAQPYGSWRGTSFASPIAAGAAAYISSLNPSLTNAQVVDTLEKSADDLGAPGVDQSFGYGRINLYKAALAATGGAATSIPSITSPSNASAIALSPSAIKVTWNAPADISNLAAYYISRNDGTGIYLYGISTTTAFVDWSAPAATSLVYSIQAVDNGNRLSAPVSAAPVTVLDVPPPPRCTLLICIATYSAAPGKTAITISWTTNSPSTGSINLGTSPTNLSKNKADSTLSTSHALTFSSLNVATTYYYTIYSKDSKSTIYDSISSSTATVSNTTTPTGSSCPTGVCITSPSVSSIGTNTATIGWKTDVLSIGSVTLQYTNGIGKTVSLTQSESVSGTTHSLKLLNLLSATTYSYWITAKTPDGTGSAKTATSTFKTSGSAPILQL